MHYPIPINSRISGSSYALVQLVYGNGGLQDTLIALLYKDGRFQFARLESLLAQAARAPGRSVLSAPDGSSPTAGGALELLLSPGVAFVRFSPPPLDCISYLIYAHDGFVSMPSPVEPLILRYIQMRY